MHAVIKSCGNPLRATPVVSEKPSEVEKPKEETPKAAKPREENPKPAAECDALNLRIRDRSQYEPTAEASVSSGAEIQGYEFTIQDYNGNTIVREQTKSDSTSGILGPGTYTAQVIAKTSLGDKTADARK